MNTLMTSDAAARQSLIWEMAKTLREEKHLLNWSDCVQMAVELYYNIKRDYERHEHNELKNANRNIAADPGFYR